MYSTLPPKIKGHSSKKTLKVPVAFNDTTSKHTFLEPQNYACKKGWPSIGWWFQVFAWKMVVATNIHPFKTAWLLGSRFLSETFFAVPSVPSHLRLLEDLRAERCSMVFSCPWGMFWDGKQERCGVWHDWLLLLFLHVAFFSKWMSDVWSDRING